MRRYATALSLALATFGCSDDQPTASAASSSTASADAGESSPQHVQDGFEAPPPRADSDASVRAYLDASRTRDIDIDAAKGPSTPANPTAIADAAMSAEDASVTKADDAAASTMDGALAGSDGASEATPSDGGAVSDAMTNALLADALLAHLRDCKLVGEGAFSQKPIVDGYDNCAAKCSLNASCAALIATQCTAVSDLDLKSCLADCTQLPFDDGFRCGTDLIRHAWICNARKDCSDGSDEVDCGTFTCTDGTTLHSARLHCDGKPNCKDGSDEAGCASYCATVP